MKKITLVFIVIAVITGCKNKKAPETAKPSIDSMVISKKNFTSIHFDNKKDPVCGMPLKAGIGDSTFYKGKLIAFCNKGCKDEFLKNPSGYEVK